MLKMTKMAPRAEKRRILAKGKKEGKDEQFTKPHLNHPFVSHLESQTLFVKYNQRKIWDPRLICNWWVRIIGEGHSFVHSPTLPPFSLTKLVVIDFAPFIEC